MWIAAATDQASWHQASALGDPLPKVTFCAAAGSASFKTPSSTTVLSLAASGGEQSMLGETGCQYVERREARGPHVMHVLGAQPIHGGMRCRMSRAPQGAPLGTATYEQ